MTRSSIGLLIMLCMLCACSQKTRYAVMRRVFDGVPPPKGSTATDRPASSTSPAATPSTTRRPAAAPVRLASIHPPYEARNCDACHDTTAATFLTDTSGRMCFSCHDPAAFTGRFVHGPVAVGACRFCHLPHQSRFAALLRAPERELCLRCHARTDITAIPSHAGYDGCIACHNPHAGERRFMLTAGGGDAS